MSELQFASADPCTTVPVCVGGVAPVAESPPRLRTLHIVNGEHYSGAERVQDLLAQRLPELGVGVDFVTLKGGKFIYERQARKSHVYEVPMRHRYDFAVVGEIATIAHSGGYRLLHAHTPRSALVTSRVARRLGIPWVYHVHSPVTRDSERWIQNHINSAVEWYCLRSASHVVVVAPSLLPYMHDRGLNTSQVTCVANGVPVSSRPRPVGEPRGTWTIGMVALFRPRKGLEVMLEALAQLAAQGYDVRLRAIGGFETEAYRQSMHELVARLRLEPVVEWTGFTSDVPSELAKIDLLAVPSLFGEGLPMVLLEGMAAGVPAVVSDVEGAATAVVDGKTGLLLPPGNASHLATAIASFVAGQVDYHAMAAAARQRHEEYFSDAAMARGVARVYESLLAQRS
jgi:glycosyltransferase involved in cell wall biosynthesis